MYCLQFISMDKIFRYPLNQHSPCIPSWGLNMLKVQPPPSHLVNEANTVIANFMCYMSLYVSLCCLVDKISVYASVKWLIFKSFISSVVTSWLQLEVPDLKLVLTSSEYITCGKWWIHVAVVKFRKVCSAVFIRDMV